MTVVEQLLAAIRDEDVEIDETLAAVVAAGEQETAVSQIGSQLLSSENESFIRLRAILVLNQLKRPSAMPLLGNSLVNDPDPSVRRFCLGSLEQQDNIQSIPYFQEALADDDDDMRQAVTVSLGIAVRELVIAQQGDSGDEQEHLNLLRQVTLANFNLLLKQPITAQDVGIVSVPEAAAMAFGLIGGTESVTYLCQYLNELQQEEEARSEDDEQEFALVGKSKVLRTVVTALGDIGEASATPCLSAVLQNNLDYRVRRLAASALGRMGHDNGIPVLAEAFLRDRSVDVRKIAGSSLTKFANWREKASQFIQALREGAEQRSQIDADGIITAVSPPQDEQSPHQLTDYFISQAIAYTDDERVMALMADLIIVSANGSKTMAGERITAFRDATGTTDERLQPLRVEIGGKALDPILGQLEKNLIEYFQKPLDQLNQETQDVWQRTVSFANLGFMLRAGMSVTLFFFGMYLMYDSYQLFKSNPGATDALFGAGVPFLTGLGTMLSMVFWGPLREIRHAVSDVGAANVAFIAYIHRVLQVSHTFSHYYLNGKISFEELEKSGKLIEDTMDDAVRVLRNLKEGKGAAGEPLASEPLASGQIAGGALIPDPEPLIPDPQSPQPQG